MRRMLSVIMTVSLASGAGAQVPAPEPVTDIQAGTLLDRPGSGGDPVRSRMTALNTELADDVLYGAGNARATLMAGFANVIRERGAAPR